MIARDEFPILNLGWEGLKIYGSIDYEQANITVLTAYFDDSGTHAGSPVVLWAGFLGPEDRWLKLDDRWRSLLSKWKIRAFHMFDCVHAIKEFEGWRDAERDRCIFEFREIILDLQMFGIGAGVSRRDWAELVVGDHKKYLRSDDEYCLSRCLKTSIELARHFSPNDQLSVVFDDRERSTTVVDRIIKFYRDRVPTNPELVSVTFRNVSKFSGMQAADMFAWESYNYAKSYIAEGDYPAQPRAHFQRFLDQGMLRGTVLRRDGIKELIETYTVRND